MIKEPDPFYIRIIADLLEAVACGLADMFKDSSADVRNDIIVSCSKEAKVFYAFRSKKGNIKASKDEKYSSVICKTVKSQQCWSKVSTELKELFENNMNDQPKTGLFKKNIEHDIDKCFDHYTKCLFQSSMAIEFAKHK